MAIEIKVPMLPESVADATIATWHVKVGDTVKRDQNLVDLETDKVVLEVPAVEDGVIAAINFEKGTTVTAGQVLATINPGAAGAPAGKASTAPAETSKAAAAPAPAKATAAETATKTAAEPALSPSVRRMVGEHDVDVSQVQGSGKGGKITKDDVSKVLQKSGSRTEERVPMSRLRARIAERLVESQQTAAILTTFNEINMYNVMEIRKKYKDQFEKRHGVKLGFMSFFTKAVIEALKRFPSVNASIDGNDIIYHGYYDIGIAVSSPRGLVVPVIRNAETLSLADIEKAIGSYGEKARDGKLTVEEMTGGTFTISNGGVFGSLLSTPIINPPQSGILGMHKIEERPIAENGQVVIRPMMYVALSYDHRIIDGRESVSFLVAVKELLEDPTRLVLDV